MTFARQLAGMARRIWQVLEEVMEVPRYVEALGTPALVQKALTWDLVRAYHRDQSSCWTLSLCISLRLSRPYAAQS